MKCSNIIIVVFALVFCGCASHPDNIEAIYVSPVKYKGYDCQEIASEMNYLSMRASQLYRNLEGESEADNWQMAAGAVVFGRPFF